MPLTPLVDGHSSRAKRLPLDRPAEAGRLAVYPQDNEKKTLKRLLRVDKPNHEALEKIAFEVWKSKVLVFSDDLAD